MKTDIRNSLDRRCSSGNPIKARLPTIIARKTKTSETMKGPHFPLLLLFSKHIIMLAVPKVILASTGMRDVKRLMFYLQYITRIYFFGFHNVQAKEEIQLFDSICFHLVNRHSDILTTNKN